MRFMSAPSTPHRWRIIIAGQADVGMLDVDYRSGEIYLSRIEIHPCHQGHGIGTRIISALVASKQSAKARTWFSTCSRSTTARKRSTSGLA